jgi:periplasmic divalent cation tolerance protein
MKIKILYTTTDNLHTAESIAKDLIEHKLSSCVQIIPKIKSLYPWQGSLEHANEISLQIKTKPELVQTCKDIILKKHNYEIPEILSIEADILNDNYENWFKTATEG